MLFYELHFVSINLCRLFCFSLRFHQSANRAEGVVGYMAVVAIRCVRVYTSNVVCSMNGGSGWIFEGLLNAHQSDHLAEANPSAKDVFKFKRQ